MKGEKKELGRRNVELDTQVGKGTQSLDLGWVVRARGRVVERG